MTESYTMPDDDDDQPKPVKVKAGPMDDSNIDVVGCLQEKDGGILADPHRTRGDIELAQMAINRGWGVSPEERKIIKARAMKIVKKEAVIIGFDKDGQPLVSDGRADDNALKAGSLILSMDNHDQADRHLEDKNARLDSGKATVITEKRVFKVKFGGGKQIEG